MRKFIEPLPLSLYIHIPWCVRKCPYCDFNSHEAKSTLPESLYVDALLQELDGHRHLVAGRSLVSIFFGGGTPSLFSGAAIATILEGVAKRLPFHPQIEITLEANPGTIDQSRFLDFRQAGINRLSLGIQSLQDDKLKILGRIHDQNAAMNAIVMAKAAGFDNFNLDLMYGLPHQRLDDALQDMAAALAFRPTHFSWYQLTIEPNTLFHHQPPVLPNDELIWDMQQAGQALLQTSRYQQYEVSAYAQPDKDCLHNRNYWEFGDYLGIGAGAHSKITDDQTGTVMRFAQVKHPREYLDSSKRENQKMNLIADNDLIFEFMLNALRLTQGVSTALFTKHTGLPLEKIEPIVFLAIKKGLLMDDPLRLCATDLGKRFLNDVVGMFLSASV